MSGPATPTTPPRSATLRVGTRGSTLAMIQARLVVDGLRTMGAGADIEVIETDGDRRAPDTSWGEGAFVSAIETALLDGRVDIAVHSAKDLPTDEDPRLRVAAYLPREVPDDVLVLPAGAPHATSLDDLATGARVGTDSPRRTAFLRAVRPDLRIHPLHGNVDTRLRRLDAGETDALVLAAAGLRRLGREDRISLTLPARVVPPAPGQGALAVQVRADDEAAIERVGRLDDPATRLAVEIERAVLAGSGGGCRAPVAALGRVEGRRLSMIAGLAAPDGRLAVTVEYDARLDGLARADVGSVAERVLELLVERSTAAAGSQGAPRVIVTRPGPAAVATRLALVQRGLCPLLVPAIRIEGMGPGVGEELAARVPRTDWIVVTSANAVPVLAEAVRGVGIASSGGVGPRIAAVGEATARTLRAAGLPVAFRPEAATGRALADELPDVVDATVVVVRGDLADGAVADRLAARGAHVEKLTVYRTHEAPPDAGQALRHALDEPVIAVLVASGSAVRGWTALARQGGLESEVAAIPLVAIGPTTATEARRLGLRVAAEAPSPAPSVVADTTATVVRSLMESR